MPKTKQNQNSVLRYYTPVKNEQKKETSKPISAATKNLIPQSYYLEKLRNQLKQEEPNDEANVQDSPDITVLDVEDDFGIINVEEHEEAMSEKNQTVSIGFKCNKSSQIYSS